MNNRILDCVHFEYFHDMLEDIFERVEKSSDCFYATVIGKYEEMRQLLNFVIADYCVEIGDIELCSEDCCGYTDEYALTIFTNEHDGVMISCTALKGKHGYFNYGADIVYILENCNSRVQHHCETDDIYIALIGNDDYGCACDCDDSCECDECHNGDNIYGFTVDNKTDNGYSKFTYYSSNPMNKTDIHNILKEFGF